MHTGHHALRPPGGPRRTTEYGYDKVGNLERVVEPKGVATTQDPHDFTTKVIYDELNRPREIIDAVGNIRKVTYDNVGNLKTATDPRGFATTSYYDLNHRVTDVVDAEGKRTSTRYDRDGNPVQSIDADRSITEAVLNPLGLPEAVRVPYERTDEKVVHHTTRYEHDRVGNVIRVRSPRSVDAGREDAFVTSMQYDALERVHQRTLPYDPQDGTVRKPHHINYRYDEVGNLILTTNPPSVGQRVPLETRLRYFDNGLLRSNTDPWNIRTEYDYNELGQQTKRTVFGEGGTTRRTMNWESYSQGLHQPRR